MISPVRRVAAISLAAMMLTLAPVDPASAANVVTTPIIDRGVDVELRAVATFPDNSFGTAPRLNMMATLGDRIFVVEERDGRIYELQPNGTRFNPVLYFDVASAISAATGRNLNTSNVGHGGLRSLAFHPDFASNGLLYVSAMEDRPANPASHRYLSDSDNPIAADSVLIEFRANPATGVVDPGSYREVFRVGMPVFDHPIKQIAFDPNARPGDADYGLLYVAHGDGSVTSAIAGGGQNNDALGKILRIDPRVDGANPYRVPASNPFVGNGSMIDEVFSLGHRNPHHLAFGPRTMGGAALLVADAGRDNVEEINLITSGADYGWPQREGTFVHLSGGGVQTGVAALPSDDAVNGFTYPVAQYGHTGNPGDTVTYESVAGGFVINNGSALDGNYFFADFVLSGDLMHIPIAEVTSAVTRLNTGRPPSDLRQVQIGRADIRFDHDSNPSTASVARTSLVDVFNDAPTYETNRADVRFGQGPDGELYVMSKRNNTLYLVTNSVPVEPDPDPDPDPDPQPDPGATPVKVGPFRQATSLAEILAATDYNQADDAQTLRLYRAYFRRDPEPGGAIFWMDAIRAGTWTLRTATAHFGESAEFVRLYGNAVDNQRFVTIVYRNVLGREPEPGGFAFWTGQLEAGMPRHEMMLLVSDSAEFTGKYPFAPIKAR